MGKFHFIIDGKVVDDLDSFVPEERHFSPSDPAYALMDLHRGFTNRARGSQPAPSHATLHSGHESPRSRHSNREGSETERSSASTRYTTSSRAPTAPAGIAGFLEAPPSRVSSRSHGSDHSTIRAAPSGRSAAASIHSGVPSVHSFAPSRHTEGGSPSYVSHAASQRTEVYAPSRQSHASSRHTEVSPASHVSSRHTGVGPSHVSSRHTNPSGPPTHSGSGVSASAVSRRTGGSVRRPSTLASGSSTLSGYDTVGPEDSISSVSARPSRSRGSRREVE